IQAWRLYGALFFGATKLVEAIEDQLPPHTLVLDLKNVIYMDSTRAEALESLIETCQKRGVRLSVSARRTQPLHIARRTALLKTLQAHAADLQPDVAAAVAEAVSALAGAP